MFTSGQAHRSNPEANHRDCQVCAGLGDATRPLTTRAMSTPSSLRCVARGERAVRKHLKARRDQREGDTAGSSKGWTFSKLEYLSRTQLVDTDNQDTEVSSHAQP